MNKKYLTSILFMIINVVAEEDPYTKATFFQGRDSTIVWVGGGYQWIPNMKIFEHSKKVDGYLKKVGPYHGFLQFHLFKCDTDFIDSLLLFSSMNKINLMAIGCESGDEEKIVHKGIPNFPFQFDSVGFRSEYQDEKNLKKRGIWPR
jgi:hypothetical protein